MNRPLDVTRPVQTRDGRKVRLFETNLKNRNTRLAGIITMQDGEEFVAAWRADGRATNVREDPIDLVNGPQKRQGWMNVYEASTPEMMNAVIYPTRAAADQRAADRRRLACLPVEFIEGTGL